jgi:hypothetical protein
VNATVADAAVATTVARRGGKRRPIRNHWSHDVQRRRSQPNVQAASSLTAARDLEAGQGPQGAPATWAAQAGAAQPEAAQAGPARPRAARPGPEAAPAGGPGQQPTRGRLSRQAARPPQPQVQAPRQGQGQGRGTAYLRLVADHGRVIDSARALAWPVRDEGGVPPDAGPGDGTSEPGRRARPARREDGSTRPGERRGNRHARRPASRPVAGGGPVRLTRRGRLVLTATIVVLIAVASMVAASVAQAAAHP